MSRKRTKKRAKRQPKVAKAQSMKAKMEAASKIPVPTPNAKIIRDLMAASKVKGSFKDYVIIVGQRLVDWDGSYDIVRADTMEPVATSKILLVHKRKLEGIVGEGMAAEFWDKRLSRRRPARNRPKGVRNAPEQG